MSSEIEDLRAQLVQSEQQRLQFVQSVHQAAQSIADTCQAEMMEHACLEAEQLVTLAAKEKHDILMAPERTATYDLAALNYDPFEDNDEVERRLREE